ncbi:MAG: transglutaminase, partial [Mesorhizobium sp.]
MASSLGLRRKAKGLGLTIALIAFCSAANSAYSAPA